MPSEFTSVERHPLRILLIEDDPVDATWLTELIKRWCPATEIIHAPSLPAASATLDQQPIDTVFVSIRLDGVPPFSQEYLDIMRRAGPRPVVALIDANETALVPEVRATGVKFVYRKHPIWRTAQIRKQELRNKFRSGG